MTYNIRHGRGVDDKVDLGRIADVLAEAEPDVITLQEVDAGRLRSGAVDQADVLATRLGMNNMRFVSTLTAGDERARTGRGRRPRAPGGEVKLARCTCGGFVPTGRTTCPHCRSTLGTIALAAVGGAIAFTLMACYGRPPCKDGQKNCDGPTAIDASKDAPAWRTGIRALVDNLVQRGLIGVKRGQEAQA